MKLLRYGPSGKELPGILDSAGHVRSLVNVVEDIAGDSLSPATFDQLRELNLESLPLVEPPVRIGPCVGRVGKFIAIGLNYSEHAAETNAKIPEEPVVFMKTTSCINGPYDDIVIPRGSKKTDWEVELGVVIGTKAKYVSEAEALIMSRATVWSTTSPSASSRLSAAAPGTKAKAATRSALSAHGS